MTHPDARIADADRYADALGLSPPAHTCHADANLLVHVAHAPAEARLALHEGEMNPPRGWIRD